MFVRATTLGAWALALTGAGCGAGPAPTVGRPNVVIMVADDLAAGILGFDGNPEIRTPRLDRLAAAGTIFTRAYIPLPQCGPSRAAMLTGRSPHRLGVLTNERARIPPHTPGIARPFKRAGYRCGFVGKWGLGGKDSPQAGFQDYWRSLARTDTYRDPLIWEEGNKVRHRGWLPDVLVSLGLEFIEQAGDDPFFLWISFKTPHVPLARPPGEDLAYSAAALRPPRAADDDLAGKPSFQREGFAHREFERRGAQAVQEDRAIYYSMVSALDRSVGQLVDGLEHRGLAGNTLLVFLSDNGTLLGEHRMLAKGPAFYEELVRTPMFMHWPGRVPGGKRSPALVSSLDLFPTMLALLGESDAETDGLDLWPLVDGRVESLREALLLEYWKKKPDDEPIPLLGIVTPNSKYTRYLDTEEEEYYDLLSDPQEQHNLAGSQQHHEELERLRGLLDDHARRIEKPFW